MDGSVSVRKSLSGTLVPATYTTVALLEKPEEENKGKQKKKVLDDEEYVEVRKCDFTVPPRGGAERKVNVLFTSDSLVTPVINGDLLTYFYLM